MSSIAASARIENTTAAVGVVASDRQARIRLAGAIAGQPDLCVRAGASARALLASGAAADLLVIHCDVVGSDALALIVALKRELPELLIIAVCESAERRSALRAMDAGVDGLVCSEQLGSALGPTVAAVLAGQTAVPRELRASLRKPALSVREKQILGMVVLGFTNAEIATRLFLAESTVKSHLSSAFRKLGVCSRSDAAARILDPHGSLGTGILAITGSDQSPRAR